MERIWTTWFHSESRRNRRKSYVKQRWLILSTLSSQICTIYPKMVKSKSKHFPKIETDVRDVALEPDCVEICQTDVSRGRIIVNHLSNSAWLILALGMMVTCIMVVCSLIHWWREEASSLNCSNFFCASASKRGWPGGGSEEMRRVIWILRNDSFYLGTRHTTGRHT